MKKYAKLIIVLTVIMTIYSICVSIFANSTKKVEKIGDDTETEKEETTDETETKEVVEGDYVFVLDPQIYLNYKDGEWYEYDDFDYGDKKFDIYINNSSIGKYFLNYGGRWLIYDDTSNYIDYDGSFLAVYSNMDYVLNQVVSNQFDIVDQSNVNSFLSNLSIKFNLNEISKNKVLYDVDKDGMRDIIYFVSNAFSDNDGTSSNAFAYVFVKYATGTVNTIYSYKESTDSLLTMSNPSFGSIITIDGKDYLIVNNEKNSGIINYNVYNMSDSFKLMYNTNIK